MPEIVFIAGPMASSGEPGENLHLAVKAAGSLARHGFLPVVPQLTWIMHAIMPEVEVNLWKEMALSWVDRCDLLLRLAGPSAGADDEVQRARHLGVPVYHSVWEIVVTYRPFCRLERGHGEAEGTASVLPL